MARDLSRLKSQLLTSGLSQKDNPLFQVINSLIGILEDIDSNGTSGGGGGGSDTINNYITNQISPLGDTSNEYQIEVPLGISQQYITNNIQNNLMSLGYINYDSDGYNDAIPIGNVNGTVIPFSISTPFVIGDMFYASSTSNIARLAAVAVGQVIISNGVGTPPIWSADPSLNSLILADTLGVIGQANFSDFIFLSASFNFGYGIQIINSNAGTLANANLVLINNTLASASLQFNSSGFTTSTYNLANSLSIQSDGSTGIAIASTNAAGNIRFVTGGTTEIARFTTNGDLAFVATKRIYLDGVAGSGDTYIVESSANVISLVSGGVSATLTSGVLAITVPNSTIASGSAQFPFALTILPSTHATSRRAALVFGDWTQFQDTAGNGTLDFAILNSSSKGFILAATTGNATFNGASVAISSALTVGTTLGVTGVATFSSTVTGGTYNGQTISSTAAFTGSMTIATTLGVTGIITASDDIRLADGKKYYVDGGSDTYAWQSASNTYTIVCNSTTAFTTNGGGCSILGVFSDTTANAANVAVSAGGVLQRSTSSRRFKSNIIEIPLNSAWETVKNFKSYNFTSLHKGDNKFKIYTGFIAEEMYKLDTNLAILDENDEPIDIDLRSIVSYLSSVVSQQAKRIELLESR